MAAPTPPSLLPLPLSPLPSTGTTNDESALTYLKAYLATSLPFYLEEFILLDEIVEPGPTFHKFPYLPAELREEVYRFYFEDAGPAPKGQPQARNTTALLRASHQVHCEARSFLFKEATLTLHVSRDYPNQPLADMVTFLERGIKYEDLCLTPYASLSSFKKTALIVERPSKEHVADHWKQMWPLVQGIAQVIQPHQDCTMNVNFGSVEDILCNDNPSTLLHLLKTRFTAAGFPKSGKTPARVFNAVEYCAGVDAVPDTQVREWVWSSNFISSIVRDARRVGRVVSWVCGEKTKEVTGAKDVVTLREMAKAVEGAGDVWLVSGGPGAARKVRKQSKADDKSSEGSV